MTLSRIKKTMQGWGVANRKSRCGFVLLLALSMLTGFAAPHVAVAASQTAPQAAPLEQTSSGVGRRLFLPMAMGHSVAPIEVAVPNTPEAPQPTPVSTTIPDPQVTPVSATPVSPSPTPPRPTAPPPNGYENGNRCGDDEFLDLSADVCRKLDRPALGFDFARYHGWLDASNVVHAACDENSFEAALEQAKGGGIVRLPACTLEVGRVNVPSQVVIEGAGIGQTILKGRGCDNEAPRRVLLIQNQSDVVLRDVSLDAGSRNCVMLEIDRATNVLIERVEIYNSTEVGMRFNNGAHKLTIRYTNIYGNGELHGIGSKDCPTGATLADCPAEMWSSSYSIHSNTLRDHGDHGMNLHGINGEVAGNLSYNNGHSGKFYDAQCIWVHHNEFRNNESWNIFIAPTLNIEERASHDLYFYKNRYLETPANQFSWGITYTGDHVTQPLSKFTDIYVMQNEYAGRLKTNDIPLSVCGGTVEDGLLSGSLKQNGSSAACDLDSYPSMGGSTPVEPLGNCPAP